MYKQTKYIISEDDSWKDIIFIFDTSKKLSDEQIKDMPNNILKKLIYIGFFNREELYRIACNEIEYKRYERVKLILNNLEKELDIDIENLLLLISSQETESVKLQSLLVYILDKFKPDIRRNIYECVRIAILNRNMLLITAYMKYLREQYNEKNVIKEALTRFIFICECISEKEDLWDLLAYFRNQYNNI